VIPLVHVEARLVGLWVTGWETSPVFFFDLEIVNDQKVARKFVNDFFCVCMTSLLATCLGSPVY